MGIMVYWYTPYYGYCRVYINNRILGGSLLDLQHRIPQNPILILKAPTLSVMQRIEYRSRGSIIMWAVL